MAAVFNAELSDGGGADRDCGCVAAGFPRSAKTTAVITQRAKTVVVIITPFT
jgi:hypothetical protein